MTSTDKTTEALSRLLADSYVLYLKTHNFHWNVTGPMFTTLHTLFETEYAELALAVDEIAGPGWPRGPRALCKKAVNPSQQTRRRSPQPSAVGAKMRDHEVRYLRCGATHKEKG